MDGKHKKNYLLLVTISYVIFYFQLDRYCCKLTLIIVTNLRSWIVERDGVDHVLMAFESKKLRSTVNVPNFTSSVITTCQASIKHIMYRLHILFR